MSQLRQCEFMLLRYVPDAVQSEAMNFGVVLLEKGWPERGGAYVRLTSEREWERLQRSAPQADVEVLRALGEELAADFTLGTATREGAVVRGELLRKYEDLFSNNVQLSERRGVLAESPVAELETLAHTYLDHRQERGERRVSGRAAILERMRTEFEARGVWRDPRMLKGIRVSGFVETRNPFKIDVGYATRDKSQFKMYHAVAVGVDANGASRLAMTFPKLKAGIFEREKKEALLTAIVSEDIDREEDETSFAIEAMEEAGVRVETVAALARIAEMAAEDFGELLS